MISLYNNPTGLQCITPSQNVCNDVPLTSPTSNPALAATVHSGSSPTWRRPCANAEKVSLRGNRSDFRFSFAAATTENRRRPSTEATEKSYDRVTNCTSSAELCVAQAESPCKDGPLFQPLARSASGERRRRFPDKRAPGELGTVGIDIYRRLWDLPYNLLSGVLCAAASVVQKGRTSFQARGRDSTASRALMKMDSELLHSPVVGLAEEEEVDMSDWNLPLAFMKKRHSEKIEGSKALAQSWRMKDREAAQSKGHRSCRSKFLAPRRPSIVGDCGRPCCCADAPAALGLPFRSRTARASEGHELGSVPRSARDEPERWAVYSGFRARSSPVGGLQGSGACLCARKPGPWRRDWRDCGLSRGAGVDVLGRWERRGVTEDVLSPFTPTSARTGARPLPAG
ncbi:hypothetical protein MATL_G00006440 [Megalops atlanticus]|uniref:Uncharacterized protein n=1 Tax=Megalops atlanticus TaxID=7932 RepID=A0A9D3QIZ6_MEGAT|nr:hypothetical protein MATL_G00006440 [Megalops atlanticus]